MSNVLEEMARGHPAAYAALVNQTKRIATWVTRMVKHDMRKVKKAESKKRKRDTDRVLRYQDAYNEFELEEGALSGGVVRIK